MLYINQSKMNTCVSGVPSHPTVDWIERFKIINVFNSIWLSTRWKNWTPSLKNFRAPDLCCKLIIFNKKNSIKYKNNLRLTADFYNVYKLLRAIEIDLGRYNIPGT